jgi:phosphatidylglycerol:prolipoprotein diacylglycerol transferase
VVSSEGILLATLAKVSENGGCSEMSFPVYLHLFGLTFPAHLIFEGLAYPLGFVSFRWLKSQYGDSIPQEVRWSVIAAAAVGAVVGSKALYWLEDPQWILRHWNQLQAVWGGKTIVGGLAGGLIAVEYAKKRLGFGGRTGDLFAVPLCVGIAVGRVGCFLSGLADDTYGNVTSLPWGIDFGDGLKRHPVQLYEIVFVACLAGFLLWRMRRPHLQGDIFKFFMVAYFGWRLAIDLLKPDPKFLFLNTLQWACCVVLAYYFRDVRRWFERGQQPAVSSAGQEA